MMPAIFSIVILSGVAMGSQFGQDAWVLEHLNHKRNGYFVEAGAGDGRWISNTLVMERDYGWRGILIEPSSAYRTLVVNRKATCINAALGNGEVVTLTEVHDVGQANLGASDNTLLSTVGELAKYGEIKRRTTTKTVPLSSILDKEKAPRVIDYLSLDVEGYEYQILKDFPFDRYTFRIIGVESPSDELKRLLHRKGYRYKTNCGEDEMFTPSVLKNLFL